MFFVLKLGSVKEFFGIFYYRPTLENLNSRSSSNSREIWTRYNYCDKLQLLKYVAKVTVVQNKQSYVIFYTNLVIQYCNIYMTFQLLWICPLRISDILYSFRHQDSIKFEVIIIWYNIHFDIIHPFLKNNPVAEYYFLLSLPQIIFYHYDRIFVISFFKTLVNVCFSPIYIFYFIHIYYFSIVFCMLDDFSVTQCTFQCYHLFKVPVDLFHLWRKYYCSQF